MPPRLPSNLYHMRAGNAVQVKLVDLENSVSLHAFTHYMYEDAHEHNISHVNLKGNHAMRPNGVGLSC